MSFRYHLQQSTIVNITITIRQLVVLLLKHAHADLRASLQKVLAAVFGCVKHTNALIRQQAALCCVEFCRFSLVPSFESIIGVVLPMLSDMDDDVGLCS